MRNFDERRAEVYRRSEERIKERKRKIKTNIAVIATPIVLCAFFAGAYFNVVMQPSHAEAIRSEAEMFDNTLRQPEGIEPADTKQAEGDTAAPVIAPENDEEKSDDSGKRYVQFEVYVPGGTASVHRDVNEIESAVKLISQLTNGEATIYGFDGNTDMIPPTAEPKSEFTVILTDNFGLEWRYAVTEDSIVFLASGKSYPIDEEQFDQLIDTFKIYGFRQKR